MRRMRLDRKQLYPVNCGHLNCMHIYILRGILQSLSLNCCSPTVCLVVVYSLTLSIAVALLTFAILLCTSIRKRLHSAQLADNFFI